jgi:hypothetical protein
MTKFGRRWLLAFATAAIANGRYVVERSCGGGSPIKAEIDVKSDSAYTEINEGNIGKMSTKETVVAQRIGDCRGG